MENQIDIVNQNNQPLDPNPDDQKKPLSENKKRKYLVMAIALVIFFILGGLGVYFFGKQFWQSSRRGGNRPSPTPVITKTESSTQWRTYQNKEVTFEFPSNWIEIPVLSRGSGYMLEFEDPEKKFDLTFESIRNYNQATGKPFTNLDELINMPYTVKIIYIGDQEGRQSFPRAGSENVNSVSFFSKDSKSIYTLTLQTNTTAPETPESDIKEEQELFKYILASFRFLGELKTAEVLVQDGSYYGPPYDPNLYQLELSSSDHLFTKSNAVNLKQYLGQRIRVGYREVLGIVVGEQQLVVVYTAEPIPAAGSKPNVYSYTIPSGWQSYTGDIAGLQVKFKHPQEAMVKRDSSGDTRTLVITKDNPALDISGAEYYGWDQYQSGSTREWFLANAKSNPTVGAISFTPLEFSNGNSFYQAKGEKINNLFGIAPNDKPINIYFGVFAGKAIIIRDWLRFPQDDVCRIMQSIEFAGQ